MNTHRIGLVVLLTLVAACDSGDQSADGGATETQPVEAAFPSPADASALRQADRDFAADVQSGGAAAWASWFHDEGAMIQPGVGEVAGRDAIRDFMAGLDDPGVSLRWEPVRADIAASGDLGWTTGTYVSETPGDDGSTTRREGRYVSIWRKADDGSWKVVMDLGNPTGAPAEGS